MLAPFKTQITTSVVSESRLPAVNFDTLKFGSVFSDHMFVADYKDGQWESLQIMPYGQMTFGPSLSALNYGQTIFEGMKAYRNQRGEVAIFRPQDHLARLNRSAERLCMAPVPQDIFMSGLLQLVNLDQQWIPKGGSLYIRPLYFATEEILGVHESVSYRLVIFSSPVKLYYAENLRVWVSTNYTRAAEGGVGYVKTAGNYARAMAEGRIARQNGYNVVLWLDAINRKFVEEFSTMNAFFVIDGVVVTPPLTGTILEGVTRDSVIRLLKDEGYNVTEREISIEEVVETAQAGRLTEAFGTGTAAIAAPIERLRVGDTEVVLSSPDNWDILLTIRKKLNDIRSGAAPDTYHWMVPVQ
jgi:branched-chain amino acid aminotransferase